MKTATTVLDVEECFQAEVIEVLIIKSLKVFLQKRRRKDFFWVKISTDLSRIHFLQMLKVPVAL